MRNPFILFMIVAGILTLAGGLAHQFAWASETAEQEEHSEGGEHHESIWDTIGKWFNFVALVVILYLFLTKTLKVPDRFKSDYELIRTSIESARQAKEEAEKRLQELDERMAQVNDEIVKIKTDAAREAEEEKKRILESAQKEAERIVEFAHREIDSEVLNAKQELREHVAHLAVEQGKRIIEKEIKDQDHKRLIEDYIEGFGK